MASSIEAHEGRASDAPLPAGLDAVLADLALAPGAVPRLGRSDVPGHRWLAVQRGQKLVGRTFAGLEDELGEDSLLLLYVPGPVTDRDLAGWRNALWPLVHLAAVYQGVAGEGANGAAGRTLRRMIGRNGTVEGPSLGAAAVLAGRRRLHAMSPAATVEKFDANAAGWDGRPGSASYRHFRWMRRLVGRFVPAAPGARVLDFGSGAGWVGIEAALAAPDVALRAFDPSPGSVQITERNARAAGIRDFEARVGFGEDPPYPGPGEEPFDLTISSGVASFAPELEPWLDGLARTVRPGGDLVVGDIHPHSRGFRRRRSERPLLPVRELNAHSREAVRAGLEKRGFRHVRFGAYQLTWPVPELMHFDETRLRGILSRPLLLANKAASRVDRAFGSPLQDHFDSWVMHLTRPS